MSAADEVKGKGKGKGKGKKSFAQIMKHKFQIMLSGDYKDYGEEEDNILKQAYLVGQLNARFHLRGQDYEYDFKNMSQKNLGSGKARKIRPPYGMTQPKDPLLPPGVIIVVKVPESPGPSMEIGDPNNPGHKITVAIPPGAQPGARMAVPVPDKGEPVEEVVKRQQGWSTGAKVAVGAAAVGALAVGGVILGEHLSGGAVSEWAADASGHPGADEAAGDWIAGAADDAGEWIKGATDDAGDWIAGATDDVGEWVADAGDDVAAWIDDAADDTGDFIMSLF